MNEISKSTLSKQKCKACEGLEDKLSTESIKKYNSFIPSWKVINNHHIEKTLKFKDFKSALKFVNEVGALAEKEGHHPLIEFTWGEVTLKLWTHALDGLSMNDFILASKIEQIKI